MSKTLQDIEQGNFIARGDIAIQAGSDLNLLPITGGKESLTKLPTIIMLAVIDLVVLSLAMSLSFLIRLDILPNVTSEFLMPVSPTLFHWIWIASFIGLSCLAYEGLYTKRLHFWQETKQLVKVATLVLIIMLALVSLGKLSDVVSRTVLMLNYIISIMLLPAGRLLGRTILSRLHIGLQPVLILGAGETGEMVAGSLLREKYLGYKVVGFLDENPAKLNQRIRVNGTSFPVLGRFRDSRRVMDEAGVRHMIVAEPSMPSRQLVDLVNRLQREATSVTVIPDLFDLPVMGVEADYSFDDRMLSFKIRNNLASPWNMVAKRAFDLIVGAMILIAFLPVMMAIAIAIKLDSKGPVLFAQQRPGLNGKVFNCYKFRTMAINAQEILEDLLKRDPGLRKEWEQGFKLKHDPRISRIGKFLRKTSFDELPQIFNIIKGEMSLVGPRPMLMEEVSRFGTFFSYYSKMRPGITGPWQVSGRNDIDYEERIQLVSWYVRNWSLWLDIVLLIRTVGVVLAKRGAY